MPGKSYEVIRQECKKSGKLYEDPDFPATDASLFYTRKPPRPFIWKRPHEISSNPTLLGGSASRFDVKQGMLGDTYFLAAMASLCGYGALFQRVVPRDQTLKGRDYAGVCYFSFWQYGEWVDVVIDDRLPTYNGKLVFANSSGNKKFWSSLLEKAYAKLHGSYEALKGGTTMEAMEDFTGGCAEILDLKSNVPDNLFQIMLNAQRESSLMGCSIMAKESEIEAKLDNGLLKGHAYSVTNVKTINVRSRSGEAAVPMVRLRNPWGNERKWNGPWSDSSNEWKLVSEQQKKEMGLFFGNDGEFWMAFEDFSKTFSRLEICNSSPNSMADIVNLGPESKLKMEAMVNHGTWQSNVSAGGCRNFPDTFATNPHYRVQAGAEKGALVIGLMQKNHRQRKRLGHDTLTIGYSVYKLEDGCTFDKDYILYNKTYARSPNFLNTREVCGRHTVSAGTYCIVPSTFKPNEEGDFLLRVFSGKMNIPKEGPKSGEPTDQPYKTTESGKGDKQNPMIRAPLIPSMDPSESYEVIREECKKSGKLYEDPDFPTTDASLFYTRKPPRPFIWKRPHEICDNPQLFVGGASRLDVNQGMLGDTYFLAAMASLCGYGALFQRVVPRDQTLKGRDYAGVCYFRFWQYGEWVDVVIDDRLPTYNDRLIFVHSSESNEFWSALLEKAYAKLHGSYEALKGGTTMEAMEDFTGGCAEIFDLKSNVPENLFQIMLNAQREISLMGCSIMGERECKLDNGLIMGHAYSITDVRMMNVRSRSGDVELSMVRIRNPWGNAREWNGPWSDSSNEWNLVSDEQKKQINLTFDDDGEFWMDFEDFSRNFTRLEICNLGPDSKSNWKAESHQGTWQANVSAGGCRNFPDTFATNPHYRVQVGAEKGTLVIGLMQKNHRQRKRLGHDTLTIGYSVYKLEDGCTFDKDYILYNKTYARSPNFLNTREVCGRHTVSAGTYCIVPSTFKPNEEGDFLLRVFSTP